MTTAYLKCKADLQESPRSWLVTGAAGFIGSHLVETLLGLGQRVVALDNFITGSRENLEEAVPAEAKDRFHFIEADIRDADACAQACRGADHVLHQAALGSVPRSLKDPATTNAINVGGFVNIIQAAVDSDVRSFVYASSSSVYGDHPDLPKKEEAIGSPLSPYAVSKRANELYAGVFACTHGLPVIGLRYFNVFGPRQNPDGPYAAVIPRWFNALLAGKQGTIFGDGKTSRDFCPVANAVQANILAATCEDKDAHGLVYNVAVGKRTTLLELYGEISRLAREHGTDAPEEPRFEDFRPGDVRHSLADISKAATLLGYAPTHTLADGLIETVAWYIALQEAAGN